MSGDPIIAVAREEAAKSADAVTESGGGGAGIEGDEEGDAVAARQKDPGGRACNKAAEPRKSITAKELAPRVGKQLAGRLEDVIKAGANDSADAWDGDEELGEIRFGAFGDATAREIGAQDEVSKDHSGGDHEAVGGDGDRAEMEKRDHFSVQGNRLAGCAAHLSEKCAWQIRPRMRPIIRLVGDHGTVFAVLAPYFLKSSKPGLQSAAGSIEW